MAPFRAAQKLIAAWRGGHLRLFQDLMVLSGGQLAGRLIAFLAFALLARTLTTETYGAVEYVVGFTTFFATVVDGGLGTVGTRRASKDLSLIPTLARQIFVARLMFAVVAVPAMALLASRAPELGGRQDLAWLFAFSLLSIPFRHEWMLQSAERMGALALMQVLRSAVFAGMVWSLVRSDADLDWVAWAEIASVAAISLYSVLIQRRYAAAPKGAPAPGFKGFGALMREGMTMGLTNLVWALNQFAPLFLIGSLIGGAQTAWFAGASRLVGSLLIFSNLYHFNLFPAVSRATEGDRGRLAELMASSMRLTAWAGVWVAVSIALVAQPIVTLVFGGRFEAAAPILEVLIWTLPAALCSGHARWGLAALGSQAAVLRSQVAGLVVAVVASIVLGRLFGAVGYGLSSLIGALVVWGVSHVSAVRQGAHPPAFGICAKPLLLAAALLITARLLGVQDWRGLVGAGLFAGLAPLLDRQLLPAVRRLGAAKRGQGGAS